MDDSPESDFIDSVTYVRAQLSVVRDGGGTYDNLLLTKHCAEILSDAVKEYEKATD